GWSVPSIVVDYNTAVQKLPYTQAATQGFSVQGSADSPKLLQNSSISNNTVIVAFGANVNYVNLLASKLIAANVDVKDNYVDISNAATGFILDDPAHAGPYSGAITRSGNINMKSGQPIH